jgi:death-on-curing protein
MTKPEFLLREVVEYLHDQAVRAYGGHFGIRDESLLESAIARAQQKRAYGDPLPDFFDLAAAYAYGLSRNHAFVDGNKRTGWAACVLFLKANGRAIRPSDLETVETMIVLAEGSVSEADFAQWLRKRVRD